MTREEEIKQALITKFSLAEDKIGIKRQRRMFMQIDTPRMREVMDYAYNELKLKMLLTITGLDEGDNLSFIYHMADKNGIVLDIKISVPRSNPTIKTVRDLFPGAEIYEREVKDLFGAKIEGLPDGVRYPLTDDWPINNYPLRKDWKGLEEVEGDKSCQS
jgi:Ni,Fe-hydrogenase III component G